MDQKRVIVVLGGGISKDGVLSNISKGNIDKAIELYNKNSQQYIIVSGKYYFGLKYIPAKTEAQAMKEYAISLEVDADHIIMEQQSLDTLGNAYFTDKIISSMTNIKAITVVAMDLHMRRVNYIFGKIFGNRFELYFVTVKSNLSEEEIKKRNENEADNMDLLMKIFGGVRKGDNIEFARLIERTDPLYAIDLDKVPQIVWKGFERRGITIVDIKAQRLR